MGPKPWNVTKVAMIGAVVGLLYAVLKASTDTPGMPVERLVGNGIGGAIGGAILFGLVALIRNWAGRPRR